MSPNSHTHHHHNHHHSHQETHFKSPEVVRDIVIGVADGLTVPFALAAGLFGAVVNNDIIVKAGVAEIVAGSIAMGLGGYLAARSEVEHYDTEHAKETIEVKEIPHVEEAEIYDVFRGYGLKDEAVEPLVKALVAHPKTWVDFMMRFELGLERPDPKRALRGAITIAVSYIVGGVIPLSPYMLTSHPQTAIIYSCVATLLALMIFGFVKAKFVGTSPIKSGFQTVLVGGLAASAAFLLARLVG